MSNRDLLLDVIDQLTQEAQSLRMAQTVQRSAYLLLARHLAKLQLIQPDALKNDCAGWLKRGLTKAGKPGTLRLQASCDLPVLVDE